MFTRRSAAPIRAALLGVVAVVATACASAPSDPLMQFHGDTVRRLTSQCYWENEGKRVVFGGHHVHSACRRWAEDVVSVRFPESPRADE